MTTIFQRVNDALTTLSPAIPFEMDTFQVVNNTSLPDVYIVYTLITGVPQDHADNVEISRTYRVQINLCSVSGFDSLPDVNTAMLAAGFTKGPERPLPKDQDSGHFILAKDFFYLEVL